MSHKALPAGTKKTTNGLKYKEGWGAEKAYWKHWKEKIKINQKFYTTGK